jgi:predicted GNAT family N-acyltransferase
VASRLGWPDYNDPIMTSRQRFRIEFVAWQNCAADLSAIRHAVFVEEQGVPVELEWDGIDPDCEHVVAIAANGQPVGTGRLLPDGHIGRMAVLPPWRRAGVGTALLQALVGLACARGHEFAVLNAQTYVIDFYRCAGFDVTSGEFLDAGIPHVEMRRKLKPAVPVR